MKYHKNQNSGFTLVELLIATSVFSIIMLISLMTFMRINRYYTKGISIARTQNAARNLVNDISTQLQLTGNGVYPEGGINSADSATGNICIGGKKYSYNINVTEDGSGNALKSEEITPDGCSEPATGDAKALLPIGARILVLKASKIGSALYDIRATLLYAPGGGTEDDELISKGSIPTDYDKWRCKSGVAGGEYCALTTISTTVERRVQ